MALVMLLIILFLLIVNYLKRKNKYWQCKGVDAPTPTIIFGNMYDIVFSKTGITKLYEKYYNEYKAMGLRYFGLYTFTTPVLVVIDPDLIKSILQTDFNHFYDRIHYCNENNEILSGNLFRLKGEKWKRLRKKLTPTFTSGKMKMTYKPVLDCSTHLMQVINESVNNKEDVNISKVSLRYTTDVIVSCAFGVDCNSLKNPNSEFIKYTKMILTTVKYSQFRELFCASFPRIADFFKIKLYRSEITQFLTDFVNEVIKSRETSNIHRSDFMSLLIKLKNNQQLQQAGELDTNDMSLSVDEIVAQVYIFLLAGYETSSTTLTFCLYELALNKNIQNRLRTEIQSVLQQDDGQITYEKLLGMSYLDMVVKETLRKYPPVTTLNRSCVKTYEVPNSDLVIDKGTNILIPVLCIHRDDEYYVNPDTFDPERFASKADSGKWLAFGDGPRNCIGLKFGLMEVKIAVALLISKFEFAVVNKNFPSITSVGVFMVPKEDIVLSASICT